MASRGAQLGEVGVDATVVLGDGPLVVIHDDDEVRAELCRVVETFEGEAAGQRTVANDGDDVIGVSHEVARLREAKREAHRGRGVTHGEVVVLALNGAGKSGDCAHELWFYECLSTAGEHLVRIGLMGDVEHDLVSRGVKDAVERHRKLDDAKVGAHVTAHLGAGRNDGGPDFLAEGTHRLGGESANVCRCGNALEIHVPSHHLTCGFLNRAKKCAYLGRINI